MATKRMLIDASHPEETRVVVLDDTRLEDYDVEVASRRQLKGNIYLAKVTRVEPSLQAAFVDYGGNRHGFLAFSEIHPDYYQIPVEDRQALLAEHVVEAGEDDSADLSSENGDAIESDEHDDDDDEVVARRPRPSLRRYKIQEVIKRRQILLVQVVKEERGNKGAALTTYLSLAGRYGVLMPNTIRGGGISRKITAGTDRSRLKKILADLDVPEGMAVIVRTAGAGRSKAEIKRDYEYLLRLWSSIRDETLNSMAPALVYEEGNLIKRSIRDLYGRDIEEIIIQGEGEYKTAKEFMKLFIPSHAKRVKAYVDLETPLFRLYGVEEQLEEMHQPLVTLKSGGSIVLNPTEALVAIDVNSGRATRERHIEETALRTNLEAADEVARQLRLRDLAGLVVVDFIDMEVSRNRAQVERRLRDAMKADRARIQLGHISQFGLMELSRQRLRPSLLETSFETCPHCAGMGVRPTTETTALLVLRKLEEEGLAHRSSHITLALPTEVAMYLVNEKRKTLSALEGQYGLVIALACDDSLTSSDYRLDRVQIVAPPIEDEPVHTLGENVESVGRQDTGGEEVAAADRDEAGRRGRRRKPRRRKRVGDDDAVTEMSDAAEDADETADVVEDAQPPEVDDQLSEGNEDEQASEAAHKKRRRGKRGGRRRSRKPAASENQDSQDTTVVIPIEQGLVEDGGVPASPEASGGENGIVAADDQPSETASDTDVVSDNAIDTDTDTDADTGIDTDADSGNGSYIDTDEDTGRFLPEAAPETTEASETTETPLGDSRRQFVGSGAGRRTPPFRRSAPEDGDGLLDQADLLETAFAETNSQVDNGEQSAEASEVTETAEETDFFSPPIEEPGDGLERAAQDASAEEPIVDTSSDAVVPYDRVEQDDEDQATDGEQPDAAPRSNVIEVGGGNVGSDDHTPRKGWWQRLLE